MIPSVSPWDKAQVEFYLNFAYQSMQTANLIIMYLTTNSDEHLYGTTPLWVWRYTGQLTLLSTYAVVIVYIALDLCMDMCTGQ